MKQQLEFNHSFIAFGQQFSFLTNETLKAATEVASDCDSVRELKSLLNAEEVFYQAEFIGP